MNVTPPARSASSIYIEEAAETPGPTRAKVKNLQNQVTELVRTNHALERKHKSTTSTLSATQSELAVARESLASLEQRYAQEKEKWHSVGKKWEAEVQRCRAEGEAMRDELNLHSLYLQQKALLALAQEQMQIVDLEEQLLQHETAKLMRDHKLSLFQSREDSLTAELKDKDALLEEKDALLIQAKRASSKASSKAHSTELSKLASAHAVTQKALTVAQADLAVSQQTAAEAGALKAKVVGLETTVQSMKAKEKELKEELDGWLRQEGTTDATKKELRRARAELTTRTDELKETQDELEEAKTGGREREKALRAQLRAAGSGGDRVASLEEEVKTLKLDLAKATAKAKKAKEALAAVRSVGAEEEEEGFVVPKKKKATEADSAPVKAKKKTEDDVRPVQKKKKKPSPEPEPEADAESEPEPVALTPKAKGFKTALKDSSELNSKRKSASPDPEPLPAAEKKKKRKILAAPMPAFQWDSIMASGDGVIPSSLSPVKQTGTGLIPRSGFSSKPSVRRF